MPRCGMPRSGARPSGGSGTCDAPSAEQPVSLGKQLVYRPIEDGDVASLAAIDDSFTTETIYEIELGGTEAGAAAGPAAFSLRPVAVNPPLVKVFPPDKDEDGGIAEDQHAEVAVEDGQLCGFAAAEVQRWNRRLVIEEIAVAPSHRGRGIGTTLMRRACAYGRRWGARTAWLETSNVNVPAIRAYQRMGFSFCGLDTTFYRGTASEGEAALFMSKSLEAEEGVHVG